MRNKWQLKNWNYDWGRWNGNQKGGNNIINRQSSFAGIVNGKKKKKVH